jgi:hypothetical protein
MPRKRIVLACALAAALAAVVVCVLAFGRGSAPATAAASAKPTACETKLLRDWRDGRIDGVYPVACYRAAMKSLPADLQVYSSADDDIAQALSKRIVQSARARSTRTTR